MAELKYKDITEKIIGASFEVHKFLGNGFQEVIYQRALGWELKTGKAGFCTGNWAGHILQRIVGADRYEACRFCSRTKSVGGDKSNNPFGRCSPCTNTKLSESLSIRSRIINQLRE